MKEEGGEYEKIENNFASKNRNRAQIFATRSLGGPSGPQLLICSPSGLLLAPRASLTSSFPPFGRSGRVTHADVSMMHVYIIHVSMMYVPMIHVLELLRRQKKTRQKRRRVQAPQAPFKAAIHSKCCIGGFRETGLAFVIVLRCD